jgi:hypothetical protein
VQAIACSDSLHAVQACRHCPGAELAAARGQVEEKALSKEKDKASQERLAEVRKELAALEDQLRPLLVRPRKRACPLYALSLPGV